MSNNTNCPKCGCDRFFTEDESLFYECVKCSYMFIPGRVKKVYKLNKDYVKLFITGFFQVLFVAVNTYFLSKEFYGGVLVCGFIISLIWSWNVKKVAFGTVTDRLIYAAGAAIGSLSGLVVSVYVIKGFFK